MTTRQTKIQDDRVVHESGVNIFADLGLHDAGTHFLKAQIVAQLYRLVSERKLNQTNAGAVMGISQPEVSRLFKGNFREYSLERLMAFLTEFDQDVEIISRPRTSAANQPQASSARPNRLQIPRGLTVAADYRAERSLDSTKQSMLIELQGICFSI